MNVKARRIRHKLKRLDQRKNEAIMADADYTIVCSIRDPVVRQIKNKLMRLGESFRQINKKLCVKAAPDRRGLRVYTPPPPDPVEEPTITELHEMIKTLQTKDVPLQVKDVLL